jgi:hypothetical protein
MSMAFLSQVKAYPKASWIHLAGHLTLQAAFLLRPRPAQQRRACLVPREETRPEAVKLVPPPHRSPGPRTSAAAAEKQAAPVRTQKPDSLLFQALPPCNPEAKYCGACPTTLHHPHRARIASAFAVSTCSVYRVS